jgi:ADP-heptose:LPS heptosyltransferase
MFPEIFLTDEEKSLSVKEKYGIEGKFYLANMGIKGDMPLKGWPISYWKELIYLCNKANIQLIQVGSIKHIHPSFLDVKSLVGQTECLREYIKLCYFSEGSIGTNSLHMHVSASFRKPCIVISGGREGVRWGYYPSHSFFHTIGLLDCCRDDGCWYKKREDCKNMIEMKDGTYYPKCLIMITPELIFDNLLQYSLLKD